MYLKISKVFYTILLFYMAWFQAAFFHINHLLLLLGFLTIFPILIHMYINKVNILKMFPIEIMLWFIFGLVVLFVSFFNAPDQQLHMSSMFTYFQFLLLTWAVFYIIFNERKIDFFLDTFILLALLSAFTAIIISHDFGGGRISMGPNNNPNSLGLTMVFAIGFLLFKLNSDSLISVILSFIIILFLTYVVILTGSRKSLLSVIIVIIFWFIMVLFSNFKNANTITKMKHIFLVIILLFTINLFSNYFFKDSIIFTRLTRLFQEGDKIRSDMYSEALIIFKQYPLFGAGMQQYRVLSKYQTYSHSTYAELLSNTGLIGSIIYSATFISLGLKYVKKSFFNNYNHKEMLEFRMFLIMLLIVIFLGFSIIHFYDLISFVFFGIMIGHYNLNKEGKKEKKNVKMEYHKKDTKKT